MCASPAAIAQSAQGGQAGVVVGAAVQFHGEPAALGEALFQPGAFGCVGLGAR
jgi:hypothetical protein